MLNLWLLARIFCASKLRVPKTFNTDVCRLTLVHYTDNSHHSCRGPTFGKKSVCLEAILAKMPKTFFRRFGNKIIILLGFKINEEFFVLWKEKRIIA